MNLKKKYREFLCICPLAFGMYITKNRSFAAVGKRISNFCR
jgi:hypothetical protein